MNDQSDNFIIDNYISEIEKDHDKFKESYISSPVSVKKLGEIIKSLNLKVNAVDAMAVLKMHATSNQRVLSEKFAVSLLSNASIISVIKNRRFFFSVISGGDIQKYSMLKRLFRLTPDQITDLVKALKNNPKLMKTEK